MELTLTGVNFTLVELIVWLIIGAIVGAIGAALVGHSPGGLIGSIAVGLIGAVLGTWLANQLGLPALLTLSVGGVTMALLWAIVGAAILVFLLSLTRRRAPRRSFRRR
jgi:uncharacterized membrane protein YeaQ/YmgE (transglycosylase-associated protein family)